MHKILPVGRCLLVFWILLLQLELVNFQEISFLNSPNKYIIRKEIRIDNSKIIIIDDTIVCNSVTSEYCTSIKDAVKGGIGVNEI